MFRHFHVIVNLRIYVTQQGADIKLPDDDTEMSKHVAVYII